MRFYSSRPPEDDAITGEPDQRTESIVSLPTSYAQVVERRSSQRIENMEKNKRPGETKRLKISEQNTMENKDDRTAIQVETTLEIPGPKLMENEDDITIIFEVLLSDEMSFPESVLGICFGPPLSNWKTLDVNMFPKSGHSGDTGTLMTGVYNFPRRLVGKTIPYKYVVVCQNPYCVEWEYIHDEKTPDNGTTKNRCLIVPDVVSQFTKLDDVVLSEVKCNGYYSRVMRGRADAAFRMLPRPEEFMDPDFSFSAVLERFEQVLKAQAKTRVCLGNEHSELFRPSGYDSVKAETEKCYMEHCVDCLMDILGENGDNVRHIMRVITYICLVKSRLEVYKFTLDNYHLMFKAFRGCAQKLCDDASLSWVSLESEMQAEACNALKLLVSSFVDLKQPRCEDNSQGDWIYVIPFIHRWDAPDRNDTEWLKLDTWKSNLRSRYLFHIMLLNGFYSLFNI
jgi:hypothetical protein